jgi:hypothetical protein
MAGRKVKITKTSYKFVRTTAKKEKINLVVTE